MQRRLRLPHDLVTMVRHLPPSVKHKVRSGLTVLSTDPHQGKPLKAEFSGLWSLRVGRFRIIYRIQPRVIEVIAIGPRATIYSALGTRVRN